MRRRRERFGVILSLVAGIVLGLSLSGCQSRKVAVLGAKFANCELWRIWPSPANRYLAFLVREWNEDGSRAKCWIGRLRLEGRPKVSVSGPVNDWPPPSVAVAADGRLFVWGQRGDLRVFAPGARQERTLVKCPYPDASYVDYWIDDAGRKALAVFGGGSGQAVHTAEARVYNLQTGTGRLVAKGEFWVLGFASEAHDAALLARRAGAKLLFSSLPLAGGEEKRLATVEAPGEGPPRVMGCASPEAAIFWSGEPRKPRLVPLAGQAQAPVEIEVAETLGQNVSRDGRRYAATDREARILSVADDLWGNRTVKRWEFPPGAVPSYVAWSADSGTVYMLTSGGPQSIYAVDAVSGEVRPLMEQARRSR